MWVPAPATGFPPFPFRRSDGHTPPRPCRRALTARFNGLRHQLNEISYELLRRRGCSVPRLRYPPLAYAFMQHSLVGKLRLRFRRHQTAEYRPDRFLLTQVNSALANLGDDEQPDQ